MHTEILNLERRLAGGDSFSDRKARPGFLKWEEKSRSETWI